MKRIYLIAFFTVVQIWGLCGLPGARLLGGYPFLALYSILIFSLVAMLVLLPVATFGAFKDMGRGIFHLPSLAIIVTGLISEGIFIALFLYGGLHR